MTKPKQPTNDRARAAAQEIFKDYDGLLPDTAPARMRGIIASCFPEPSLPDAADVIAKAREAVNAWKAYETDDGFKTVQAMRGAVLDLSAELDQLDAAGKEKP